MLKCLLRILEMRGSAGFYVTTNGKMLKCLRRILEMPLSSFIFWLIGSLF